MRHFISAEINFLEGQLPAVIDEVDCDFIRPFTHSIGEAPSKGTGFLEDIHVEQDRKEGDARPTVADELVSAFEVDEEEVDDEDDEGGFEDDEERDAEGAERQFDLFDRGGGGCLSINDGGGGGVGGEGV
jgi:hypothetical protein